MTTAQTVKYSVYLLTTNTPIYDINLIFNIDASELVTGFSQLEVNKVLNNYGELVPTAQFIGRQFDTNFTIKTTYGIVRCNDYIAVLYRDLLQEKHFYPVFYDLTATTGTNLKTLQSGL